MALYKHLLVPTDGSAVAAKAFKAAVTFAAESGARITGYYAIEDMNMHHVGAHLTRELIDEFERRAREAAEKHVAEIGDVAKAAGVPFEAIITKTSRPHEGIIEAAGKCGADIIFMATHGHRGLAGMIMGSVTQKVLTHSKIPVLVFR